LCGGSRDAPVAGLIINREEDMHIGTAVVAAGLALFTGTTFAETADPGVNQRQANQRARIEQGVASGELTAREAARLRAEQRAIKAEERAMKADGKLTLAERHKLQRDLNASSRHIHRQKHDAQKR
jgi:hypothetical protein